MKAMIIKDFGSADVFEEAEIPKPVIKQGHVLIKIEACSVNPVDTMIRSMGKELPISPEPPAVLGMDFSGTIEDVSEDVDSFSVGDEVYGCAGGLMELQGSLAEYIVADAQLIALKPKNLSMREAAALPLVGITAYEGLHRAGISINQKVLVHGGAGGVGHIAAQLATYYGADAYATGGNTQSLEYIEQLGVKAINYKNESVKDYVDTYTQGDGFDIIFDSVGGENLLQSFEASKLNGQIATTVSLVEIDLSSAHFKGLSLHVVFMLIPMIYDHNRQAHGIILQDLAKIVEEGGIKPIIDDHHYSLDQVNLAHKHLESGEAMGKIVISISHNT